MITIILYNVQNVSQTKPPDINNNFKINFKINCTCSLFNSLFKKTYCVQKIIRHNHLPIPYVFTIISNENIRLLTWKVSVNPVKTRIDISIFLSYFVFIPTRYNYTCELKLIPRIYLSCTGRIFLGNSPRI